MGTMGDEYAMKAAPELLMESRSDRHPTEVADLFGRRLAVASETHQGRKLNEAFVKDLTGGEPIKARRMRENFWQFVPTHKVVLLTNHKPVVVGTDEGIWRRLRLVPFEVTFWNPDDYQIGDETPAPELRQDKHLDDKLAAEREGILAWMVQGCLAWQREGLPLPEKVRAATRAYRASEDALSQFLAERCLTVSGHSCRASHLYQAYKTWSEGLGEEAMSGKAFGNAMTERGHERYTNNGTFYRGVVLRQEEEHINE
jgi:putative DNA primase/helicase